MIGELSWQKLSPHTPTQSSSKELRIFMGCFSRSKLSDTLLPVINHFKGRPIDLHLSMILEEKIIVMSGLRRPPPNPLQCTSSGRSCMGTSSSRLLPAKTPTAPTYEAIERSLGVTGCRASVYLLACVQCFERDRGDQRPQLRCTRAGTVPNSAVLPVAWVIFSWCWFQIHARWQVD